MLPTHVLLPLLLSTHVSVTPSEPTKPTLGPAAQAASITPLPERRLRPRWRPSKTDEVVVTSAHDTARVIVKLADGAAARAVHGRLALAEGAPGAAGSKVAAQELARTVRALAVHARPLFDLSADELDDLVRVAEARAGAEMADLTQYFLLDLRPGVPADHAVRALLVSELVEHAELPTLPPPPPGDVAPPTPLLAGSQGYLGAAPIGLGVTGVRALAGGTGLGRQVCDVEYSWNLAGLFGNVAGHEDLSAHNARASSLPCGSTASWFDPFNDTHHGTAVAGILCADFDGFGVDGIAPAAVLRVSCAATTSGFFPGPAILRAVRRLQQGDVIVVELQDLGPNLGLLPGAQFGLVPVEYNQPAFDAIRVATATGIHVIEAAGNGEQDLDTTSLPFGHPSYRPRFDPAQRLSGAVLVAAGTSTVPHVKTNVSNNGRVVSAYAWGQNVASAGYGDLFDAAPPLPAPDPDQLYTATFAGTSSASAIVGGAATLLAARSVALGHGPYRPEALRLLLRSSGTPVQNPPFDRVGNQPALADQFAVLATGRQAALLFAGRAIGEQAGTSVDGAGDVNGDGRDDLVVGAPLSSAGGGNAGRAYLVSGLTGEILRTFTGAAVDDRLGQSVAGCGDVDRDGRPDVVIGAPRNDAGGVDAGRAYVHSGSTGALLWTFTGTASQGLGESVDGAGDLDGDGWPDLVVGMPFVSANAGRARAYSGRTGAVLYTWNGPSPAGLFGLVVRGVRDVNGDGRDDVAVAAPVAGGAGGPGGLRIGEVFVFSGASGAQVRYLAGPMNGSEFGRGLDGLGDLDGDGYADLVVGAPAWGFSGQQGLARVISGQTGLDLYPGAWFTGGSNDHNFGASVARVGDVDGDGIAEFAIGAPNVDQASGQDAGAAYLYDGATGALVASFGGQSAFDRFGAAVAAAGDLDGDGRADLAVGARENGAGGPQAGRVYTYLAPPPGPWFLGGWGRRR